MNFQEASPRDIEVGGRGGRIRQLSLKQKFSSLNFLLNLESTLLYRIVFRRRACEFPYVMEMVPELVCTGLLNSNRQQDPIRACFPSK